MKTMINSQSLMRLLGVDKMALSRLRRRGLPHINLGERMIRYDVEKVEKWISKISSCKVSQVTKNKEVVKEKKKEKNKEEKKEKSNIKKKEEKKEEKKENKEKKENIIKEKLKFLKHIFLEEKEFKKLREQLGEEFLMQCIEKLNNYISVKGEDRYPSHYNTIKDGWVIEAVKKDNENKISFGNETVDLTGLTRYEKNLMKEGAKFLSRK